METLKIIISFFQNLFKKKEKELHLIDLAKAMAQFEGYYLENSRARRNNNPLNLKWSPYATLYDMDDFCMFETPYEGWKACLWDLEKKCRGYTRTGLKPTSTIQDLIYVWSETNQREYLKYVCQKLKILPTFQLKDFSLKQLYLTMTKRWSDLIPS
jgi:hypothetical protein